MLRTAGGAKKGGAAVTDDFSENEKRSLLHRFSLHWGVLQRGPSAAF
jgi:hypothetical protein